MPRGLRSIYSSNYVLRDGVNFNDILPLHIPEFNNIADPFTKYLVFAVWRRHMHYLLNLRGPLPPRVIGRPQLGDGQQA